MPEVKIGARLKSDVCATEVMVIAVSNPDLALSCGGSAMIDATAEPSGTLDATQTESALLGKRYINAAGEIELLCVKAGEGTLAANGEALVLKDAKPLPSSD